MKIAVCIPAHGDTKAPFAGSLAMMIQGTLKALPAVEFQVFMASSSILIQSRTQLFLEAVRFRADYILWADADHVFPQDALVRLLRRARDVIGVNYPRRDLRGEPTASRDFPGGRIELVWTTPEKRDADLVEEVDTIGFGFALINMRAMRRVGPNPLPLFNMNARPDGTFEGEDAFFFRKLRSAGIKIFVDHSLSWEVGHLFEYVKTNEESYARHQAESKNLGTAILNALKDTE